MSLFSALQTSLSSLQTTTAQMQLVSNNIANANNVGYTRKSAVLGEAALNGGGGGGAQIVGYGRATDDTLTNTLNGATSDAGMLSTQDGYLKQVQTLLGANSGSNPPLSDAVSQFASAWQQLAAQPESNVQQQQVVQAASNLVSQIKSTSSSVETLDRQVSTDISTSLNDLNTDLSNISSLNQQISSAISANQPPGDLQDQRDALVQKISGMMNVTVLSRPMGQIALYTSSGYSLVDGQAQSFTYDGTNVLSKSNPTLSLNGILTGGSLQAQVDFRSTTSPTSTDPGTSVIQKLRSQLDTLASAFTTSTAGPPESFAHAYASATGNAGEASSIFTGTDRTNFAVNPTLLNGTETVKVASPTAVEDTFNDSTKSFTAAGLSVNNASYATLASGIVSSFQQAASSISQLSTTATQQQTYLQQQLTNETGVNVDTETINLTTLQNTYAASAHVLSVISNMFTTLFGITT